MVSYIMGVSAPLRWPRRAPDEHQTGFTGQWHETGFNDPHSQNARGWGEWDAVNKPRIHRNGGVDSLLIAVNTAYNKPHMMRRIYIHQQPGWPRFHWRQEGLVDQLAAVRHRQGRLLGRMEALGFDLRQEAMLETLTEDVVTSSEIEGEILDVEQVRSSVARRLGMDIGGLTQADRNVEGIVELMLDATERFSEPLAQDRLFGWHTALFPTGRSGMRRITVGGWRDDGTGPMQVVSGPIGRERVHFEASRGGAAQPGNGSLPGLVQRTA